MVNGTSVRQHPEIAKSAEEDEADFARRFYWAMWEPEAYQRGHLQLSRELLFHLDLPDGTVVMLGTHNGRVFEAWCDHWGAERCLGIDLANPTNHPRIRVADVRTLEAEPEPFAAFVWNDIGSWQRTPQAREAAYLWTRASVVPGGYLLERGDEVAGWPLEDDLARHEFVPVYAIWSGAYALYRRAD